MQDASASVFNAINDFIVAGFTGAGYTQEQAERYAANVPADRISELKALCMLGSGTADFTKAAG